MLPVPLPSGIHSYRLIAENNSSFANPTDDTLITTITTSAWWVTPELGTTDDLDTHTPVSLPGLSLSVSAGMVSQPGILCITELDTIPTGIQPDFAPVPADSNRRGWTATIHLTDSPDQFITNLPADVTWNLTDSISTPLSFCRLYSDFDTWIPVQEIVPGDSTLTIHLSEIGQFALFKIDDAKPPEVEATVNGQRFLRNSYVNTSPQIHITARDENGLDARPDAVDLWLNRAPTDPDIIEQLYGEAGIMTVQLAPTLMESDTSLSMVVHDAAGNPSDTLRLAFIVHSTLDLIDYGNFPNPFTDRTRFTYELTETVDDFSLDIFTVSGRRIRRFTADNTLSELDPRVGAYHEIVWDGRSKNGDFVANGVYFYRLKVKLNDTTIERKGKIAKAR